MTITPHATPPVIIKRLGQAEYASTYKAMQGFTDQRDSNTPDELWILEHPPVYTLGLAGKEEHLLNTGQIPVHHIDRGGQVTYHGLGQLVVYVLMDVKRRRWGVRQLVTALEQAVIDYLASYQVIAERRDNAPGVYVADKKISALGLRVRRGCSYHGLSLNNTMDTRPFNGINPCGYEGLEVTQLIDEGIDVSMETMVDTFIPYLIAALDYTAYETAEISS